MSETTTQPPGASRSATGRPTTPGGGGSSPCLGVAELMVILDNTIVNIALPTAQHDLGFSNADRQWIVTAYSLAFGSLCCSAAGSVTSSAGSGP